MSVRESTRTEGGPLGAGTHQGEDGRLPVAEAGARRPVRVRGMDRRQSPPPHEVRWLARGQGAARCQKRVVQAAQSTYASAGGVALSCGAAPSRTDNTVEDTMRLEPRPNSIRKPTRIHPSFRALPPNVAPDSRTTV